MARLRELAPDVWVADQPLRFFGAEIGARMTVLRLSGGRLFLHSAVERTPELAAEVERLGTPAFLVAPNRLHHLYVSGWRAAYPGAELHLAPGVAEKRPDLAGGSALGDAPPPQWSAELDQAFLAGFPIANEVVFFHRASGTLVTSDLAFFIDERSPAATRLGFRLMGAYGRLAVSPFEKIMIRDRAAYRRALERVLAWPFSRMVLAHGSIVETDAKAALERAYAWLLR